jgi:hypothetical protein
MPQTESALAEIKSQVKMVLRRLTRNSESQASIESGPYTLQYGPIASLAPYNHWQEATADLQLK